MSIRQAHEEWLLDLRLLLEANPTLSSTDAASMRLEEVRLLLIIIID